MKASPVGEELDEGARSGCSDRLAPPPKAIAVAHSTAEVRLAASRLQLRAALIEIAFPKSNVSGSRSALGREVSRLSAAIPGVATVVEIVKSWWHDHPLRRTAEMTCRVSESAIAASTRKHPAIMMAASAAAGAALVLGKPWRFVACRKIVVGAASLLLSQVIKSGSAEFWLRALLGQASSVPS